MRTIVLHGVTLAVCCSAWTFFMGFTGFYKDPVKLNLFWMVVVFQLIVLTLLLRKTRAERTYAKQVAAGTLASLVAAPILFASSLLFTTVAFPRYFDDLRAMHEQILRGQGLDEAKVQEGVRAAQAGQTRLGQASAGAIGTVVTGLVFSALLAIALRKKPSA